MLVENDIKLSYLLSIRFNLLWVVNEKGRSWKSESWNEIRFCCVIDRYFANLDARIREFLINFQFVLSPDLGFGRGAVDDANFTIRGAALGIGSPRTPFSTDGDDGTNKSINFSLNFPSKYVYTISLNIIFMTCLNARDLSTNLFPYDSFTFVEDDETMRLRWKFHSRTRESTSAGVCFHRISTSIFLSLLTHWNYSYWSKISEFLQHDTSATKVSLIIFHSNQLLWTENFTHYCVCRRFNRFSLDSW